MFDFFCWKLFGKISKIKQNIYIYLTRRTLKTCKNLFCVSGVWDDVIVMSQWCHSDVIRVVTARGRRTGGVRERRFDWKEKLPSCIVGNVGSLVEPLNDASASSAPVLTFPLNGLPKSQDDWATQRDNDWPMQGRIATSGSEYRWIISSLQTPGLVVWLKFSK